MIKASNIRNYFMRKDFLAFVVYARHINANDPGGCDSITVYVLTYNQGLPTTTRFNIVLDNLLNPR